MGNIEQCRQLRFFCTAADLAVIGFVAQQQTNRIQSNGLARAGFSGQYGKAALKIQIQIFNNDKITQRKC
ncbi:Uncharacterised protein [Neisseria meningitidis]|nr:Uncharacterised protein [Neisseria meningitidis]CWS34092.1 Uncharacterised protein [Neisseria meningitidis]CWS48070.1 Uncharacterised protein [Neisseria meningitidis]